MNNKNGSLITQKETVKGVSTWKQQNNIQGPCVTVAQEEWKWE